MKLPRDLSGTRLARHLCRAWGYALVHQVGSHIVLQTETPGHHRIVIPAHTPLRVGTLNGILQAVAVHKGTRLKEAFVAIVPLCEIELGCEPLARVRRTSHAPPPDL